MRLVTCLAVAAFFGHSVAVAQVASAPPQANPKEWTAKVQRHLLDRINKSKPAMLAALKKAQASGMTGDVQVMVRFVVARDGKIQSTEVTRSSGNSEIDGIAEQMVKRASPVPAIPAAVTSDTEALSLPIRFRAPVPAKK